MLLLDRPTGQVEAGTPLTLAEYLGLPEDTRCEIVDGVLRPMVRPSKLHRRVQRRLASLLEGQLTEHLRVEEEEVVIFRTTPPEARIPDVVVFRPEADPRGALNYTPAKDVLLAVEVVSQTTQTADRYEKPGEYARNGIPAFWRIELEPSIVVWVYRLVDGVYQDEGRFGRGDVITDPTLPWISVEVDHLLGDYADEA